MRRALLIAATVPVIVSLASCGDDDDDGDRTVAAYCADLQALDDGDEGGPIDAIFEEYGDSPTLANWAAFLPGAIDEMQSTRDEFADVEPPEELEDEREGFLAALDAVIGSFEDSLDAAEAGDQAEFDRLEVENQDENVPAMGAAMQAVMDACADDAG
jgi:hypothetical protein